MTTQKVDHTTPNDAQSQLACIRSESDDGIHVLAYTEISRKAIDELAQHITDIYHELLAKPAEDVTVACFLIDSRIGSQPVKYTMARMRETVGQMKGDHKSRIAIVLTDNLMMNMLSTLSNQVMRGQDEFRLFRADEYDAAFAWLRANP